VYATEGGAATALKPGKSAGGKQAKVKGEQVDPIQLAGLNAAHVNQYVRTFTWCAC
jgi:hypothetical protein